KLIEDLEAGDKIFVYKNIQRNLTDAELVRLHAAVRKYGNSTLLYIRYADETHPNGTVEARAPGLLVGFIDHFAFSPEDKPLGSAHESLYAICQKAYRMYADQMPPEPPPRQGFVSLASQKRRVALVGNCQAQAMMGLYQKFAAARTGDVLTFVPSYAQLTAEGRAAIEQADLVVEQLFDIRPQADTVDVAAGRPRLFIPMVTAGFLWPFAGQPHPSNADYPFLVEGPYGGEASDSYLNRLLLAGTDPEEAVETYMRLDVAKRTNLDRMYELIMDRQRSRDEAAGYNIADVIERYFKTEQIFLTPYHPNTRVAVALATQFFQQMGADRSDIARMQDCTRRAPFPKTELPLHPSVCEHFGLKFVNPDRRYRYMNEGLFTVREYALRYLRFEWNEPLEEGISLVHDGNLDAAHDKLLAGLVRSPESAPGHNAMSLVLTRRERLHDALIEARRAVQIESDFAPYRTHLGMLLQRLRRLDEAEAELRTAAAADPMDRHNLMVLAHLLHRRGQIEEACELVRSAVALDPYVSKLHEELAGFLEAKGDLAGALLAQQQAVALAPESIDSLLRMAHFRDRLGQLDGAAEATRAAVTLDPHSARARIALSDLLLRQGKLPDALNEALMAVVVGPDNALAYSHLGHVLHRNGDTAAETAFRRAAQLDPANAHVRHQLSDFLHAQQRLEEAVAAAREATGLEPGNPHRFVHLARLLLRKNDIAGAEAVQRQAVALNPTDVATRVVLSDLLARLGRRQEALDEARLAVEHQPDSAHALGHLAHILQLLGSLRESEELYCQALDLAPGNDHLRGQLAHVQSRRQQAERV
ncbi:MAG TPA: WcbI family polysaccharide biosynthesis putative acetyltransferase, partial [Rhodopila sp.]